MDADSDGTGYRRRLRLSKRNAHEGGAAVHQQARFRFDLALFKPHDWNRPEARENT
jgi:hypothetical protein